MKAYETFYLNTLRSVRNVITPILCGLLQQFDQVLACVECLTPASLADRARADGRREKRE